jgi:hypothetical protein
MDELSPPLQAMNTPTRAITIPLEYTDPKTTPAVASSYPEERPGTVKAIVTFIKRSPAHNPEGRKVVATARVLSVTVRFVFLARRHSWTHTHKICI